MKITLDTFSLENLGDLPGYLKFLNRKIYIFLQGRGGPGALVEVLSLQNASLFEN